MHCPNCGRRCEHNVALCPECGESLWAWRTAVPMVVTVLLAVVLVSFVLD